MNSLRPPQVSVVIPTYRRPALLQEAIHSVLRQKLDSIEIFVVDDCPNGSAAEAVAAIADPRITYFRNPAPTGGRPAIVRNLAWPLTKGTFVHFLDDDDIVAEGHYTAAIEAFARFPAVGVVFGRIEPFGDEERLREGQLSHERAFFARAARRAASCERFGSKWAFAARMVFHDTLIVCSAAMIRRECVVALGGFDPELPLMEDVDFYGRAIRRFGAHFLDRLFLHYRISRSLVHRPGVKPRIQESSRRIQANYRAQWGLLDFFALKVFARTVQRIL